MRFTWPLINHQFEVYTNPVLLNGPGYAVPLIVDTGAIPGRNQFLLGPEFAAVIDSWTIQAEWAGRFFTDAVANAQNQGTVLCRKPRKSVVR